MSQDKEREAFEAWYFDKNMKPPIRHHLREDEYEFTHARDAWEGWQARAALATQPPAEATDWVLAIGYALGLDSGYSIPIVPSVDEFKRLFAEVRRRAVAESQPPAVQGEPYAHIVELPAGEYAGTVKFFTAPSDPRGRPVYLHQASPPSREVEPQWLPIETAPKDGKVVLLGYHNSHGNWRTMRGCWLSKEYIDEYWEDPEGVDAGWFEVPVEADEPPNCWPTEPTHWMPLPAAPGTTKKEGT